jgi:predicted nucleic acid-binding protein
MTASPPAIRKLVLDTNVLFPLLVYEYAERLRLPAARRNKLLLDARSKKPELVIPEDYERWLTLFQSVRARLTTQHVIAELYGLRGKLDLTDEDASRYWQRWTQFLVQHEVEQRSCTLDEIQASRGFAELNARLGPTDAGLILLARNEGGTLGQEAVILATDDGELYAEARHVGVRSELLPNLVR